MDKAFKYRFIIKIFIRILILIISAALIGVGFGHYFKSNWGAVLWFLFALIVLAKFYKVSKLIEPGWDGKIISRMRGITRIASIRHIILGRYFGLWFKYIMTVKSDTGRIYNDVFIDYDDINDDLYIKKYKEPNRFEYYFTGERVRKHRGFDYFEKFNKSGKVTVICINCGKIWYKTRETCFNCGLPLLKEDIKP